MGLFNVRKPRPFHHEYIYYDERKERLAKMEEKAKRELGMLPEEEFDPEKKIRGKFVEATTHLKRRKASGKTPVKAGVIIIGILLLLFLWHYLQTGNWEFV